MIRSNFGSARLVSATLVFTLVALFGAAQRALAIDYTWNVVSGNWNAPGSWTPGGGPPTTLDTGTISANTATVNATLAGDPDILLDGTGVLFINAFGSPLTAGGTVTAASGGRIHWQGISANTSLITLDGGGTFGKPQSNVLAVSNNALHISSGASATARNINATVTRTNLGLQLNGPLTSGDALSTLVVNPSVAGQLGALVLNPSVANSGFTGKVHIQQGPGATTGTLVLGGTGALSNIGAGAITIDSGAQLRFRNATNPLPVAGYALSVGAGARVEWESGGATYTGITPTITFLNGSTFGHEEDNNVLSISRENIVIGAGATVTASRILASVARSILSLEMRGVLSSGDVNSTLVINPTTAGYLGGLVLVPTTANPFDGHVVIEAGPGGATPGSLILSGTGALANVNTLTVNAGSILRFRNAVNPLPSAYAINIPTGGRMEWEGASGSYSVTPPTITFQDGSEMGRHEDSNVLGVSREHLVLAPGATVTASRVLGTLPRTDLGIRLDGTLSGSTDSKWVIDATPGYFGPVILNPSTANLFPGTVEVKGNGAANEGHLVLQGTGPLANAALLDIQAFGNTTVLALGAADDIGEIRTHANGTLRFRSPGTGGTTLSDTSLTGNGRVRSELIEASLQNVNVDQALRPLALNNVVVAPGNSIGTLTVQATNLLLTGGSQVTAELSGAAQDMLIVQGGLTLDSSTVLDLVGLDDNFATGFYPIISYTGGLTGTFGTVIDNLSNGNAMFLGIDYGTVFANMISVQIYIVPEPSTGLLLALGTVALVFPSRRRRQSRAGA